eukprot:2133118-Amphidinium_carterae.1
METPLGQVGSPIILHASISNRSRSGIQGSRRHVLHSPRPCATKSLSDFVGVEPYSSAIGYRLKD